MPFTPLAPRRLPALLREQAARHPDRPALLAPGHAPLSHAELWQRVDAFVAALRAAGVQPTTRVAVLLPDGPAMATVLLALLSCAVCAPLNPRCRPDELRFALEDGGARFVIGGNDDDAWRDVAGALGVTPLPVDPATALPAAGAASWRGPTRDAADDPQRDPTRDPLRDPTRDPLRDPTRDPLRDPTRDPQAVLLLHTSGTTARPKLVALSDANLAASALNIARHLALQPADRCLGVMPLFHIHGLVGTLLASLASGGSIVCTPGFDDEAFFDWIAQYEPSWYSAVPTIHQAILANAARYRQRAPSHRFRFVRSSSAALPPASFEALEALTGAPVIEAYGMTEAAHQIASNPLPPAPRRAGSVGLPAGADIVLLDEAGRVLPAGAVGEIAIRGPGVTGGYERNAGANAAAFSDGWLRTGDLGRFDADGYLGITGRLKEIVNRGGEKLSPREVDDALTAHPAVAQAAAFAVPHASLGEDLAAAVVLRDGAQVDEAGLRAFLFERLSPHKVPSALLFVDAIPKAATGKVQRMRLNELLGARLARAYVGPRDALESALEQAWRAVLGSGPIGVHDNFFGLGGDSLQGARAMLSINAALGLELPAAALFRHPTIAALALELRAARTVADREAAEIAAGIERLSDDEVRRLLDAAPAPDHG